MDRLVEERKPYREPHKPYQSSHRIAHFRCEEELQLGQAQGSL
jgi:hypothetical protein